MDMGCVPVAIRLEFDRQEATFTRCNSPGILMLGGGEDNQTQWAFQAIWDHKKPLGETR